MKAGNTPLPPLWKERVKPLFLRRHRAQIGHDGVEVAGGHPGVILEAHRRLELAAVLADAGGDRGLDLRVGPGADALRGDVARHRLAPRPRKLETAGAELAGELAPARTHRRMALHAMADGGEVEAVLQLVVQHGFR